MIERSVGFFLSKFNLTVNEPNSKFKRATHARRLFRFFIPEAFINDWKKTIYLLLQHHSQSLNKHEVIKNKNISVDETFSHISIYINFTKNCCVDASFFVQIRRVIFVLNTKSFSSRWLRWMMIWSPFRISAGYGGVGVRSFNECWVKDDKNRQSSN